MAKQKVLAILPMLSAPLSFLGSTLIVFLCCKSMTKVSSSPYHRILFLLSSYDIVSSIAYGLSTLPMPSESISVWGASGNNKTCTAQGFLIHNGLAVVYYNAMLMLYYTLTIQYNISQAYFKKKIEPICHTLILSLTLVPSIIGVCMDIFEPVRYFCYIRPNFLDCFNSECPTMKRIFAGLWLGSGVLAVISFLYLPIGLFFMMRAIKSQEKRTQRKWEPKSPSSSKIFNASSEAVIISTNEIRIEVRKHSRRVMSFRRTKMVRNQALCYVSASILCLSWALINSSSRRSSPFVIQCLGQFFYPLQGFFNFFNYIRPRILKVRKHKLATSWSKAIYLVIFVPEHELRRRVVLMQFLKKRKNYLQTNQV